MFSLKLKTLTLLLLTGCALPGFIAMYWVAHSSSATKSPKSSQLNGSSDTSSKQLNDNQYQRKLGGQLSVNKSKGSILRLLPKSQDNRLLLDIAGGHSFFSLPWISPPTSTTSRDGLGPLFNARNCIKCHHNGGRGRAPSEGEEMRHMLIRLSIPGKDRKHGVIPEPVYGTQLQLFGNNDVKNNSHISGEAVVTVTYKTLSGQYPDGEPYQLTKPEFMLKHYAFGPMSSDTLMSPRNGSSLVGMGLIEMIPSDAILSLIDEEDTNNDGISGRANQVWSREHNKLMLGRYGLKANTPTLRQQVTDAFVNDIGITSSIFPNENCGEKQTSCLQAKHGRGPRSNDEIDDVILSKVVNLVRYLPVPYSRIKNVNKVKEGEAHFHAAGCPACHQPSFTTKKTMKHELLSLQKISPYSDFLLHDMGADLADGRPDFEANGSEWRTAPLWAMKWRQTQGKFNNYLHDGRASSVEEAILWHSGEAEAAKHRFMNFNKNQRQALLDFIESL